MNDKRHGHGIFSWKDGRMYDGQWKNGKQHGRGIFLHADGSELVGEWNEGQRIRWITDLNVDELKKTLRDQKLSQKVSAVSNQ